MKIPFKKDKKEAEMLSFNKELENAFNQIETDIYKSQVKHLKAEVQLLRSKDNLTRDMAAIEMFREISKEISNPEKAAEDAFRSADAFMRVRDRGKSYQEDILEKLKQLAANISSNEDLGAEVRLLITKYIN